MSFRIHSVRYTWFHILHFCDLHFSASSQNAVVTVIMLVYACMNSGSSACRRTLTKLRALFVVQLLELCFEWVRVFLVHPDESLCQLQTQLSVRCHRDRHCGTCTYSRCFKTPLRARALTLSLRKILWVREMGVYVGWGIYSLFRNKCSQKNRNTHIYTNTNTLRIMVKKMWEYGSTITAKFLGHVTLKTVLRPFFPGQPG